MKGFTLIEAVLALAIMALSAFALMSATSRCVAVARSARNYQTAVTVLVQLKDSLVSGETDALQASVTGPSGFTYITSGSCASLSAASPGCQVSYATASLTTTATFVFTLTVCTYCLPISYALIGN